MDIICVGEMLIDFTPGSQPDTYTANPGGIPALPTRVEIEEELR